MAIRLFASVSILAAAFASAAAPVQLSASEVPEVGVPNDLPGPGPYVFVTAEQPQIVASIVADGLANLYAIAFLPGGDALVVERGQRVRLLRGATGVDPVVESAAISGIPDYSDTPGIDPFDVLGIQDVEPDPDFADNGIVYLTYNRPVGFDEGRGRITASYVLAKARLSGLELTGLTELLVSEPEVAIGGSRIVVGEGGMLFAGFGGLSEGDVGSAQELGNLYGKVVRVRTDGTVPDDNPFVGHDGARGEIWTYGHRDPLGLAFDPKSGRLVASEHGPQGGDELNELLPGRNYGWPTSTYGTEYAGSALPANPILPDTQAPLQIWSPGIAPNGIAFYTGTALPGWQGNLFVSSARRGQINGTGALIRVAFNDSLQEMRQEILLDALHQRFKDVQQGPDGLLYAVTDEANSRVIRIGPAGEVEPAPERPAN